MVEPGALESVEIENLTVVDYDKQGVMSAANVANVSICCLDVAFALCGPACFSDAC